MAGCVFDAKSQSALITSNPATLSHTCTGTDRLLVLSLIIKGAVDRTGGAPTYAGVAMTQIGTPLKYATSPEQGVEMWYLPAPASGANTLSVPNSGALSLRLIASSYTGAAQLNTLDVYGDATGVTANPSKLITTLFSNGEAIVDVCGNGGTAVETGRSHILLYANDEGQWNDAAQYTIQAIGGAITFSHTMVADDWALRVASFKPSDPTVDKQVAASGDDGRRYSGSGGFNNTEGRDNVLGYYNVSSIYHAHGFARWTGVTIEGTIGANSYIQCHNPNYFAPFGTPQLKVYFVDESDPPAPTTAGEFDADPLTTLGVDWDGAWTQNTWAQSPSLAPPLQEYVDTFGPIVNKALMMQIKNDGGTTERFNYMSTWDWTGNLHGPKLHIEYTAGGGASYSLVVDAGSYSLAGTATDLLKDVLISAASGGYALTGAAVGLKRGLVMGAGVGSYALSGSAVDFPVDRVIGAGAGSYSITGATISLLKDMLISAGVGSYALTGTAVSLIKDMLVSAGAGNYALTGSDVGLHRGLVITASGGTYSISGTAASLLLGRILSAAPGTYAIIGTDADLLKALIIIASGGTYVLTGSDAGLLYGKIMVAGSGSYVITGTAADLLVDLVMQALGGSYVITGKAATLTSGAIIVVGHPTGYAPFYPTPKEADLHATPKEDALHATPKQYGSHATPKK